jgi:hypothetical protein
MMPHFFLLISIVVVYSETIMLQPYEVFTHSFDCDKQNNEVIAEGSGETNVSLNYDINLSATNPITFKLGTTERYLLAAYNVSEYSQHFYESWQQKTNVPPTRSFSYAFINDAVNQTTSVTYSANIECNPRGSLVWLIVIGCIMGICVIVGIIGGIINCCCKERINK